MIVVPVLVSVGALSLGAFLKFVHHRHMRGKASLTTGTVLETVAYQLSTPQSQPLWLCLHTNTDRLAELKALPDRQNEEWLLRPRDLVLKINNEQHMFPFDGQRQSVHQLAIDFCSKNGADLGFDMRSFQDCVAPLVGALQMSLQDNSSSTALAQNGGGNNLSNRDGESSDSDEDSSDSDGDSSNRGDWRSLNNETFVVEITLTGRNFRQHDKTNGNGSGSSINENASDDSEKVSADVARVSLEINGVTYLFEYSPQVDAAIAGEALGKQFCSRKGPELLRDYIRERNINDKAELRRVIYEGCTKPISAALVQKIEDTLFAQANGAPSSEKVIANGNSDGQSQDLANSLQELHSESGDASELVAGNG